MATSPSAALPSSSMESQQPDQPISAQQDGGEADHVAVTSQPASAEPQTLTTTTGAPEGKQTEEEKAMDHLTVINENMETSKYSISMTTHQHHFLLPS